MVRRKQLLTNDEFIEAVPEAKTRAELWIQVIDDDGNPTLDRKKLGTYIYFKKAAKKIKKNKNQGKKQKKLKF